MLAGVYRLRLPLPWPGVPHCNAWAVMAGDGVVLFDTGMHQPDSVFHLERAMGMVGLRVEDVRLVVCTHAHSDHYGQAATITARAGCELWMHPKYEHMTAMTEDADVVLARRLEIGRQSGVPKEALRRFAAQRKQGFESGISGVVLPDRELVPGVVVPTDLGEWTVHYTPGHAPSHVCLFGPELRLLISGDHLLGRISLYFDYGHSPDPVGEFLSSLDVVEGLGARLCLPGHGRTFTDVRAHVEGNRKLVAERLAAVQAAIADEPLTAFEIVPRVYDAALTQFSGPWLLTETLSMLHHLERLGSVARIGDDPERWSATVPPPARAG